MLMEWTTVSVIVVLVGLVAALAKPMLSLCKEITNLRGDLQALSKAANDMTAKMAKFETDNHNSHKRLWEHNTEQDEILQNHEMRLHDLDGK